MKRSMYMFPCTLLLIVGLIGEAGASPFLYSDGMFTTFDVPGGIDRLTQAYGINDRGQIVGAFSDATFTTDADFTLRAHGFLKSGGDLHND